MYTVDNLIQAAGQNRVAELKKILKKSSKLLNAYSNGKTALHEAAANNAQQALEFLIKQGAKIDAKDNNYLTILHIAILHNREPMALWLIDNHSKLNTLSDNGYSPFLWAARWARPSIMRALLNKKHAKWTEVNAYGQTALHIAIENGQEKFIVWLTNVHSELNSMKDDSGNSPFLWAARWGYRSIMELLINLHAANWEEVNSYGQNALHFAIRNDGEKTALWLINEHPELSTVKDKAGNSPFLWAAHWGCHKVMQRLIDRKDAKWTEVNHYGQTALHHSIENDEEEIALYLIRNHFELRVMKDDEGNTPLLWAAHWGRCTVMELLLQSEEIQWYETNNNNYNALHLALDKGQYQVILLLLAGYSKLKTQKDKQYQFIKLDKTYESKLFKILQVNTLASLDFSMLILADGFKKQLSELLSKNADLIALNFSHTNLPADVALHRLLSKNANLEKLNLSHNPQLGNGGWFFSSTVQELAKVLTSPKTVLHELNLEHTSINDYDAKSLALALCSNTHLRRLSLRDNAITEIGAKTLLDMLSKNMNIVELDLADNKDISTELQNKIKEKLAECRKNSNTPDTVSYETKTTSTSSSASIAADMNIRDKNGSNPLCIATINGSIADNNDNTVLASNEQKETVSYLINKFPHLSATKDQDGPSAYLLAAINGHISVMQTLLKSGVGQWDETDFKNQTAFHLAALNNQTETVFWLLQENPEINTFKNRHLQAFPLNDWYEFKLIVLFRYNPLPNSLNFSGLILSDLFKIQLINLLLKNTTVRRLNLSNFGFSQNMGEYLYHLLSQNKTIMHLDLSHNSDLLEGNFSALQGLIKSLPESSLIELKLNNVKLNDENTKLLAQSLISNTHLLSLSLVGNSITDVGANALFDALSINTTIEELDLTDNTGICQLLLDSIKSKLKEHNKNSSILLSSQISKETDNVNHVRPSMHGFEPHSETPVFQPRSPNHKVSRVLSNSKISSKNSNNIKSPLDAMLPDSAEALGWEVKKLQMVLIGILVQNIDENDILNFINSVDTICCWVWEPFLSVLANLDKNSSPILQWMQDLECVSKLNVGHRLLLSTAIVYGRLSIIRNIFLQTQLSMGNKQIQFLLEETLNAHNFFGNKMSALDLSPLDGLIQGLQPLIPLIKDFSKRFVIWAQDKHAKKLSLSQNKINEKTLVALFEALQKNTSLEILDLSQCPLTKSSMQALAKLLEVNPILHTLDLSGCDLTDDHLNILLEALGVNQTLQNLNLSHNCAFTNQYMSKFSEVIANHPSLKHVSLYGSFYIKAYWYDEIERTLISNKANVQKECSEEEIHFAEMMVETEKARDLSKIFHQDADLTRIADVKEDMPIINENDCLFELPAKDAYELRLKQLQDEIAKVQVQQNQLTHAQHQQFEQMEIIKTELSHKCNLLKSMITTVGKLQFEQEKARKQFSQKQNIYYTKLYKRLANFFIACCVVDSGLISRSAKGTLGKVGFALSLCGGLIDCIPGVGLIVKGASSAMMFTDKCRENQKMRAITRLGDLGELQLLAHDTASRLTLRYCKQINKLYLPKEEKSHKMRNVFRKVGKPLGMEPVKELTELEMLAEYAVARIMDELLSDNVQSMKHVSLSEQMLSFISTPSVPILRTNTLQSLYGIMGQNKIKTVKDEWILGEIYLCPGVLVNEVVYVGEHTNRELYGVRDGTQGEVNQWGLKAQLQVIDISDKVMEINPVPVLAENNADDISVLKKEIQNDDKSLFNNDNKRIINVNANKIETQAVLQSGQKPSLIPSKIKQGVRQKIKSLPPKSKEIDIPKTKEGVDFQKNQKRHSIGFSQNNISLSASASNSPSAEAPWITRVSLAMIKEEMDARMDKVEEKIGGFEKINQCLLELKSTSPSTGNAKKIAIDPRDEKIAVLESKVGSLESEIQTLRKNNQLLTRGVQTLSEKFSEQEQKLRSEITEQVLAQLTLRNLSASNDNNNKEANPSGSSSTVPNIINPGTTPGSMWFSSQTDQTSLQSEEILEEQHSNSVKSRE